MNPVWKELEKRRDDLGMAFLEIQRTIDYINARSKEKEDILAFIKIDILKSEKERIINIIIDMSYRYGLDRKLICAVITQESGWDMKAVSSAGAIGLMQIMPETGAELARLEGLQSFTLNDLFNPIINIQLGCHYLASLLMIYQDISLALAHYNGGFKQARRWAAGDERLATETKKYVPAVMKLMKMKG